MSTDRSQELRVRLYILVESSDHGGECGDDNRCRYSAVKTPQFVPLPAQYKHAQIGDYITTHDWSEYLVDYDVPSDIGWEYCAVDPRAKMYGLTRHEVRARILSAKVVEWPTVKKYW